MTSAPPNPARNQHYVPQFYLRKWVTGADKRLWCCRVEGGRVLHSRVAPKSTASELDLYRVSTGVAWDEPTAPDLIEKTVMQALDDQGADALRQILAGVSRLSDKQRRAWARFLNGLLERDPYELSDNDQKASRLADDVLRDMREQFGRTAADLERLESALVHVDGGEMARTIVRQAMVQEIRNDKTLDYLLGMRWSVVEVGFDLITSDRPLLVNAGASRRPLQFMTIALSPRCLFTMAPAWKDQDEAEIEDLLKTVAVHHNQLLLAARPRRVYSGSGLADADGYRLRSFVEHVLLRQDGEAREGAPTPPASAAPTASEPDEPGPEG